MKKSIQVFLALGLVLSQTSFARTGENDAGNVASNREELRIARTEKIAGELTLIQGRLQITDSNGRTFRIDDQKGIVRQAYNAGNRNVLIEGMTNDSGAVIAQSLISN